MRQINVAMLRRVIGSLMVLEAFFMLLPLATSLIYRESDWVSFAIAIAITGLTGFAVMYKRPESRRMGKREGFLLTSLVWIVFSLFGLIPFVINRHGVDFSSAFFEAMSSFTTTGATSLPSDSPLLTHGIKIWQAMMQWLGGMGIILFTLVIIPTLNSSGGMQMFNAEVTGVTKDKLMPRVSQTAAALWGVYLALTVLLVILLWAGPMSFFDSICHAFGTMSTGGFSSRANSIAEFESDYVLMVITVFMFLGGVNMANIFRAATGRFDRFRKDEVMRVYIGCILAFTLLFSISKAIDGTASGWRDVTLLPLFQVVSTITSTGYVAPGFSIMTAFVLTLTFFMMFMGGCAGSTSGGAKIDRVVYLRKYLANEIRHVIRPNEILSVKINGTIVNPDLVSKVVAFLCLYFVCIAAGGLLLSILGQPAVDSFFSSFACISNTGFGASVTGYGDDYLTLSAAAKWILAALMLIGRLEIYTILVLMSPGFWKR